MNEVDPLGQLIRVDQQLLIRSGPPPNFTGLWQEVLRREARVQQERNNLFLALPVFLLFSVFAAALLGIAAWHVALPCLAVAAWIGGRMLVVRAERAPGSFDLIPDIG